MNAGMGLCLSKAPIRLGEGGALQQMGLGTLDVHEPLNNSSA